MHRTRFILMAALAAATCTGCTLFPSSSGDAIKPALDAWVTSDMTTLTNRTEKFKDPLVVDDGGAVNLFSGSNETVSFQVVVDVGAQAVNGLRIAGSALTGPGGQSIPAKNIQAFHMLPVQVSEFPAWYLRLVPAGAQAAEYYDALVPVGAPSGGQPFALPAGQRMAVWVDVAIGRNIGPGVYTGFLELASDTHQVQRIPIRMEVLAFVLPDIRPIPAIGGFDHQTIYRTFVSRDGKPFEPTRLDRTHPLVRQGLPIIRQMMVLAHEHRLDLFERTLHPSLRRDISGRVNLDWEDYDNIVLPYLSGSAFEDKIGCPAWPAPFSNEWPDAENYGGVGSEEYSRLAAQLLADSRKHFRAINAADQIFLWPYRGPVEQVAYERHAKLASIARMADVETPILSQLPPQPPPETLWTVPDNFANLADIVAPPAQWLEPSLASKLVRVDQPLRGLWIQPGMPPYLPSLSVTSSAADVRTLAWFADRYRCTALMMGEVLNWAGDPFLSPAGAETRLFYPGKTVGIDGVIPSVRLKRLRRGLQDLGYFWILRQRGKADVADAICKAMARYGGMEAAGDNYQDVRLGGWVQEPATWSLAQRLLAEEVQATVHPEMPSNQSLVAQQLKWKQFDEQSHEIHVEQVRAYVRPTAGKDRLSASVVLELFNEFSRDADVLVKLENLPEGWKPLGGEQHLAMKALSRQVITLTAQGAYVPTAGNGKMPVSFSITTDMRRRKEYAAGLPFLIVGRANTPPKIDGKLDDWPSRIGNTAGDFKAIGRRGEIGTGQAARQTLAFAMVDDQNLYLAFRCDEPAPLNMKAKPNNIIHYEQLMACGEDLVEIILDPGAAAKGPEDLYHITVKSNGSLLTEKGVHTDPPLGKASAWPVSASVAVDTTNNLWTVEMAIPLEAFGPAAKNALWSVNFTRFATQGSEASSWSAAARYFYDPRNLGTMLLPVIKN